jgi:ubiquinone/menaquinone biosynthesis C-methylase UbiE
METKHKVRLGFDNPTDLPTDAEEQRDWQSQNRDWWESNPMRYDWNDPLQSHEHSREFFEEIDRRHFFDAARYAPPQQLPFDELIPYSQLREMDVLEIGIGNGSHAQLIAPRARSYTGIDLTDYAVNSTRHRFELFDLSGRVLRMDAEKMDFPDNSFDFVWTWGVIHHSANTERILKEMARVLRPGGRSVVMVYHRSLLYYYLFCGFFRGILCGGLIRTRSLHKLVQQSTDGAIARVYSVSEWRALVEKYFAVEKIVIKGQKSELFPLPAGRFKEAVMNATPSAACRFVLNNCRQGSFIISTLRKPGAIWH